MTIENYSPEALADFTARPKKQHSDKRIRKVPRKAKDELPIYAMRIEMPEVRGDKLSYPFLVGFFDGVAFREFWGDDCLMRAREYLFERERGLIYFYDGDQRDDFKLIFPWFEGEMIIHERTIIGGQMDCRLGKHRIGDSMILLPLVELEEYRGFQGEPAPPAIQAAAKEPENRDARRAEIVNRVRWECGAIWQTLTDFRREFGTHLTIGAASIAELKKHHYFQPLTKKEDAEIRELFYIGGRCDALGHVGVFEGDFKLYDVNSMYPAVMKNFFHPVGRLIGRTAAVQDDTCFVIVRGESKGHLPWHGFQQKIHYYTPHKGEFCLTIHEWRMALKLGLWASEPEVIMAYSYPEQTNFASFVNSAHWKRRQAKRAGNALRDTFYKGLMNAASGKFAQNPNNYFSHEIHERSVCLDRPETVRECEKCRNECCFVHWEVIRIFPEFDDKLLWRRRTESSFVLNVATAASITGAARAILARAILGAVNPMYCDTDSLICESIAERCDDVELGAWKQEAAGHRLAIAGPKRYALFGSVCPTCKRGQGDGGACTNALFHKWGCVKMACSGADVEPSTIEALALKQRGFADMEMRHSKPTLERMGSGIVQRLTLNDGKVESITGIRGEVEGSD
jgi:Vibrio phage DNA polymerase